MQREIKILKLSTGKVNLYLSKSTILRLCSNQTEVAPGGGDGCPAPWRRKDDGYDFKRETTADSKSECECSGVGRLKYRGFFLKRKTVEMRKKNNPTMLEFLKEWHLYWGFTLNHLLSCLSFTSLHPDGVTRNPSLMCSHYTHSSLSQFSTALTSCLEGKGWVEGGLGPWLTNRGYFWRGEGCGGDGGDGWRGGERRWFTPALISERLVRIMFAAGVWAVGGGGLCQGTDSHPDFTQVCNLMGPPAHTHRTIFVGEVNTQTRQPQDCPSEYVRDQRLPMWDTSWQNEV